MDHKDKFINVLLEKYKLALTRLDKVLQELHDRPKTLEEFAETNEALRQQLNELVQWKVRGKIFKQDNEKLRTEINTLSKDYWGRPKKIEAKPSKKNIQQDDYIKAQEKAGRGEGFDYVVPIFVIEALKFYEEVILDEQKKKDTDLNIFIIWFLIIFKILAG